MVPVEGELPLSGRTCSVCLLASELAPRCACWPPRAAGCGSLSWSVADRRYKVDLVFGVLRLPPGEDTQVAWSAGGGNGR